MLAERFELRRRLGSGAFGTVYEAYDHEREARVALKELTRLDAAAIYSFKQEFRALADVVHEHLVVLHELFSVGDSWYLTMDLVEGCTFLDYVRGMDPSAAWTEATIASDVLPASPTAFLETTLESPGTRRPELTALMSTMAQIPPAQAPPAARVHAALEDDAEIAPGKLDVPRLRRALAALAAGVHALHATRRLHRDLKPSNVLVTADGRVKILDFGLVTCFAPGGSTESAKARIVGTPAYMSPEQAAGKDASPASDWYAVGAMLYEALTGRLPFAGGLLEVLAVKQFSDPVPPRALVPDLPEDLCDLCARLLSRDPDTRAGWQEIAHCVGGPVATSSTVQSAAPSDGRLPFVGRAAELSALSDALSTSKAGRSVVVHLHGTSGMGKSDLARRFLDDIARRAAALVLEGRCHERESVPYKAFDGVIDALTQHLLRLPEDALTPLLPRDVRALARLFPVLRSVPRIASAPPHGAEAPDLHELRRRASAALRELIQSLARARPLVLSLDDLQWGDNDSVALITHLLEPPAPPPLLLLACYRSEEAAASALVQSLPQPPGAAGPAGALAARHECDVREVKVPPLSHEEASELARRLFLEAGIESAESARHAETIARESGGSPFFVQALARYAMESGAAGELSLSHVLVDRVRLLPAAARRVLEVVAVAGWPVDRGVVKQAASLAGQEEQEAVALLRAGCLVRGRAAGGHSEIEAYHDRIRESVVRNLDPGALRETHGALGHALEAAGGADPEALMTHFQASGDRDRARGYAERAAERAAHALAFDRAASLYRTALDLASAGDAPTLRRKVADALANAGRGPEAGRAYLLAAEDAPPAEALDARRRAAEQFLRSGHIDEGLEAVNLVLPSVGLDLPKTPGRALASLLARRLQLGVRGLRFQERDERELDPIDLTRIDVCWSIGNGLGGVDVVRGADFQARHLLLSLRAGESYRVARALAWEAIFAALEGRKAGRRRAAFLVARSTEIAQRIQHPHALAWSTAAEAIAAWCKYAWRPAEELSERTIALFREACADIAWEVGSMNVWWLLSALIFQGKVDDAARRAPAVLKEAEDLGDLYGATSLRTYIIPWFWMQADRPEEALREVKDAIERWSKRGFHLQHWCEMFGACQALLYKGDGARALSRVEARWKDINRSFLLRSQPPRIQTHQLRARTLIATAARSRARAWFLLRTAEQDAALLEREEAPWPWAYAIALRAGIAAVRRQPERAAELFAQAAGSFEAQGMAMHVACARRRRGELLGGGEGRALIANADAWMAAQNIRNPERMAAMLFPG